jgi:hypothetical protein
MVNKSRNSTAWVYSKRTSAAVNIFRLITERRGRAITSKKISITFADRV